ncbi:MAG: hypothetical protein SFU98_15805 [Leptospiraceae bacterium]|nr:hypothetical protein [Leptospiraceae bacterium]
MPNTLTRPIRYNTNLDIVINPQELIRLYLHGLPLCSPNGVELSNELIKQKIIASQRQLENSLNIKLFLQIRRENTAFIRTEYNSWGYVNTSFPVLAPLKLEGYINLTKQITYPRHWLSVRKEFTTTHMHGDDEIYHRHVYLVPSGNQAGRPSDQGVIFNGITPYAGFLGHSYIPNYWMTTYLTGFYVVPQDIIDVIGKMAAIELLAILGDIIYQPGATNSSVSLDGVSQSVGLTRSSSGGLFDGRIKLYTQELKDSMEILKNKYKGVTFNVL